MYIIGALIKQQFNVFGKKNQLFEVKILQYGEEIVAALLSEEASTAVRLLQDGKLITFILFQGEEQTISETFNLFNGKTIVIRVIITQTGAVRSELNFKTQREGRLPFSLINKI